MSLTPFDAVGLIGVLILLTTYFLLQLEKLDLKKYLYSILNLCGALLIFISLLFNWNLAAGLIEIFWMVISIVGLYKVWAYRRSSDL